MHQLTLRDSAFIGGLSVEPPDIDTTNLGLWLKADVGCKKTGGSNCSDGDGVETWENQGGVVDAIQTTGGFQPIFKTGILNGLPIVRFDGSDDTLSIVSSAETSLTDTLTFFAVVKFNSIAVNNYLITKGVSIFNREYTMWVPNSPGLERWRYDGNFADFIETPVTVSAGVWYRLYAVSDATRNDRDLYINTTQYHSAPKMTASATAANAEFGYLSSTDIAEAGLYSRGLTTAEISALDDYLVYKYAL